MDEITVRSAIEQGECSTVEFKKMAKEPKAICKEIAAFATGEGGMLLIGVADDRTIFGLTDAKVVRDKVERWIYEHIVPAPAIDIRVISLDERQLVAVETANGTAPFYMAHDIPYIRIGTSSQPLQPEQIIDLVRGRPIEEMIKSFESTLAVTRSMIASTQAIAISAQVAIAPGIFGQGELATMQYNQVRQKIFAEIGSSPVIMALQSSIAVANAMASAQRSSPAPRIQGQGDLATMNYADLIDQLMKDPQFVMALSSSQTNASSAIASAASAQTVAQKAINEIAQLKAKLATIVS
ncbi:hypothetical protein GGR91_000313 [Sphingorhabdus rigui]|uniref:Schlafen AlbA-2 domain-containing protein n=1 Tax=Sphingorhabdus rigui TaxID=1282858 RepID=A0A840AWV7_9SPHN|nr:ATP-binding protein [Sphingorhabdus rigui]MBB3942091.1 hypothetical protein [Sphingorhabdus rigui]